MKIEKIKPIPKYIEKKIKAIDATYPVRGRTRFTLTLQRMTANLSRSQLP